MKKPHSANVTIRDVAGHAGVSKSTVSRYLQSPDSVSERARVLIGGAIDDLDYYPSAAARSLTRRQTGAIGVLVHDLRQPWFVDFLSGLSEVLDGAGYYMLVCDTRLDGAMGERLVQTFAQKQVDGLVLAGTMSISPRLADAIRTVPTVIAGNHEFDDSGLDVVIPDDVAAARLALMHLRSLGHESIAHVAGRTSQTFALRADAYRAFMTEHGLERDVRVVEADATERGGRSATLSLLAAATDRPTAVFAATDLMAIGVMSAAKDLGVVVPEELSVVGIDATYLAANPMIDLTSVDVAAGAQGRLAADRIVRRIADHRAARSVDVLPPAGLEVRGSTGPVPAGRRPPAR